jgi:hypothetical protein
MFEFLALLLAVLRAGLRSRADLVAENLLLRHQLAVLTRPTRKRAEVRSRDMNRPGMCRGSGPP